MGVYFLDTSALVKRYVAEPGRAWVAALCAPNAAHTIVLSQAALVEAVATFCRKARETDPSRRISEAERDRIIGVFRRDVQRSYALVRVTTAMYARGGDLCRLHTLRAYDSVQLACALAVRARLAALGETPTFVCADNNLLRVAQVEGLAVENPQNYP